MSFEMFKEDPEDRKDSMREDTPEIVGNEMGDLKDFAPNAGEDTDILPPLEEKDTSAKEAEAWLNANDPLRKNKD